MDRHEVCSFCEGSQAIYCEVESFSVCEIVLDCSYAEGTIKGIKELGIAEERYGYVVEIGFAEGVRPPELRFVDEEGEVSFRGYR